MVPAVSPTRATHPQDGSRCPRSALKRRPARMQRPSPLGYRDHRPILEATWWGIGTSTAICITRWRGRKALVQRRGSTTATHWRGSAQRSWSRCSNGCVVVSTPNSLFASSRLSPALNERLPLMRSRTWQRSIRPWRMKSAPLGNGSWGARRLRQCGATPAVGQASVTTGSLTRSLHSVRRQRLAPAWGSPRRGSRVRTLAATGWATSCPAAAVTSTTGD